SRSLLTETAAYGVATSPPVGRALASSQTPTLRGTAGTASGDNGSVTVKIYDSTNTLYRTLTASVGSGGNWSVAPVANIADGSYKIGRASCGGAGKTGASAQSRLGMRSA